MDFSITKFPKKDTWPNLCFRPTQNLTDRSEIVAAILQDVRKNGDKSLIKYAKKFDGCQLKTLIFKKANISKTAKNISAELKAAIQVAYDNIYKFHAAQVGKEKKITTTKGVQCWRKSVPIDSVGLYIPGGSAPLFSTLLMLAIPAKIAGCKEIVLCTPPQKDGTIDPAIAYTLELLEIDRIFLVGGAQAIAAMAYGTDSIPKVNKIFGPGNSFVTIAKQQLSVNEVAIDMPAGPSEVAIIADSSCVPSFVAADLLAQAEHGPDSQVILLCVGSRMLSSILEEVKLQLAQLPRKDVAEQSLLNSKFLLFRNVKQAMEFSNEYAPEHLILACNESDQWANEVRNAGSVFIGNYTPESAGDYASGTNHTLPTNGFAKMHSGVSLDTFMKKITFQKISKKGLDLLGPHVEIMAEAESLQAHSNAVKVRRALK